VSRVFRQIATAVLVATILFALAACSRSSGGDHGKDVAATVNGKEIMLSEVDRLVSQQAQGQKLSTLQQAAVRLQALDNLIQREAVYLRTEKEKTVPTDDELNTYLSQQKQQYTAEEWAKKLSENKLTEEQVRDEARKDLAINKLQDKLFGKITIRDQEIVDFYNNNREQFVNPRGVSLADIVTDPRDSGGAYQNDAKSDAEAAAKINSISAQLKTGADFATVAVGIYDRRGSRLTYSLAGHPPPIFSGVAAPEPLTICSSPPIGWTMPTGRRQSSVTLPPRSEVCFFSDGLVEARLEEGLLGRERLSRILGELGQRAQATDLLERVTDAARETPDDMAACILAPEVGAISERVHVEELEADLHDLASGEVNRFMQACRIPSRVIAPTIEHASEIASASGTVLLRMDLGSAGATVTAVAPPVAALVPLPVAPAASRETDRVRTGALSLDEQAPVEQPPLPSLPLRRASDRARSATGPATAELL